MADIPASPRKPFSPPALLVYGDLAAVTQTIGMLGPADSGKGSAKGTRV